MNILRGISIGGLSVFLCQILMAQTVTRTNKPDSPAVIEWKGRMPAVDKILSGAKFACPMEHSQAIVGAFGTRTESPSVALVDYCPGGAYTDWIVAVRLEHGKPVLAEFRDARGKHVENAFANGASVMHSVDVKLVPEKNAIYDLFSESDSEGRPAAKCSVKAYVWNLRSRTFDLDTLLSQTATGEYCRSLRNSQ